MQSSTVRQVLVRPSLLQHAPRSVAAVAGGLVLALAGCASTWGLQPTGELVNPDQLQARRSLSPAIASPADFPTADWWHALGDPQLDRLITQALQGTPGTDAADARVRKAMSQAGLADAMRKPHLAASARYAGVRIPETVAEPPLGGEYSGIVLVGLNLDYSPDLWGGQRAKWQAALGEARAMDVDAQAARLTLASSIASTYVSLAQAFEAGDVAQAEAERAQHLADLSRQRVDAGLDNQLQVHQAESTIAAARQQSQAAGQQVDTLRNALAELLGKGPDRGLAIQRPTLLQAPTPGVPSVVPSELLGHRPDVVAARWRVEAASQGIAASKAAFRPSVNLAALVGVASGGLSDLFSSQSWLVQGGPALSLPIFDGGALRNQLAGSDADYDLAVAGYNQVLVTAVREVADALQSARALDARIASTEHARSSARSAWEVASARYGAGLGTQLDVLAAQQPLLQLDQQLAALRAQRLQAVIALDHALGGGLSPSAVPVDSTALHSDPDPTP